MNILAKRGKAALKAREHPNHFGVWVWLDEDSQEWMQCSDRDMMRLGRVIIIVEDEFGNRFGNRDGIRAEAIARWIAKYARTVEAYDGLVDPREL